jgi:hypothetical protein
MKNHKKRDYSKKENRIKHKINKKQINKKRQILENCHYQIKLVLAIPYIGTMVFSMSFFHDLLYY